MNKTNKKKPTPKRNGQTKNTQQHLPTGWTEAQLWQLAHHYENQSEEAAVAEDEARASPGYTMMSIPTELVSKVAKMIARHDKALVLTRSQRGDS